MNQCENIQNVLKSLLCNAEIIAFIKLCDMGIETVKILCIP